MADIALSQGVRQNLLAMQKTVDLMGRTQNRLATGKKVNSALDNPTSYFVSAGLENRANDLSRILDSMGLGDQDDRGGRQRHQGHQAADRDRAGHRPAGAAGGLLDRRDTVDADTPARRRHSLGDGRRRDGEDRRRRRRPLTVDPGSDAGRSARCSELVDAINGRTPSTSPAPPSLVQASIDETGKLVIENVSGRRPDRRGHERCRRFQRTPSPTCSDPVPSRPRGRPHPDRTVNAIRTSLGAVREPQGADRPAHQGHRLQRRQPAQRRHLKVIFNETNTTLINIQGVVFNSQGLGLSPLTTAPRPTRQ